MSRKTNKTSNLAEMPIVDNLVAQYQAGDLASGEELLRRFGGHPNEPMSAYIGKFYLLIRSGRVVFKDKDTRRFIRLFIQDKQLRDKLIPFYSYSDTKQAAMEIVKKLRSICSVIPDDEFKQDLRYLFLVQAKRFEKKYPKIGFLGYICNSYCYALYHYINRIVKTHDPYLHQHGKMLYMQDDKHYSESTLLKIDEKAFTAAPTIALEDELGNSWDRGITCADEFKPLSMFQRMIIRLSFDEGKSDREIAEKTHFHINTINRQKLKAIQIIKDERERLLNGTDDE